MSTALIATIAIPLRPERHRPTIHVLPQQLDVPRIRADQQRLEVQINHLLGNLRRQRRVADANQPVVREDLANQPAVKCERSHRRRHDVENVHRVGAEMRWKRSVYPRHSTTRVRISVIFMRLLLVFSLKPIPHPRLGQKISRARRIRFELLPELVHVDAHVMRFIAEFRAPTLRAAAGGG